MRLITPILHNDSRENDPAAGSRQRRWKKPAFAAAILLLGIPAFSTAAFAQYGSGKGVFGSIMNQSMQPPRDYYQPSPPPPSQYQQSYQPQPYPQQPNTDLQYEETDQLRRANTVGPHPQKPKVHTAVAAAPAPNGVIAVKMKKTGGTFEVPVRINNTATIDFTVDSGASDVMIPANVVSALIKSGSLKTEDYIGGQTFTLADGSKLPSIRFKLASLQVGDQTLTDVVASVAPSAGSALLGQSFLSRFASWTLDNTRGTLTLTMRSANAEQVAAASAQSGTADPAATVPAAAAAAAAPTQPADATKPAPGDVAPVKVASASAAPNPSPDASAHIAFVLPAFPNQTKYADARTHLMALGYEPQEVQACDPANASCFPERVSCFGTDVIQCKFQWKHGDTAILVQTVNYPPTVAMVECEKNCQ